MCTLILGTMDVSVNKIPNENKAQKPVLWSLYSKKEGEVINITNK